MADKLNPSDDLKSIGSIVSQDGRSTLVMQGDGNLVLYRSDGRARWASNTVGKNVGLAVMQGDGNFVMYGPGGDYIWDTATDGHPGAYLIVQNDGNVVIYDPAGRPLWATNTMLTRKMVPDFLPSTAGLHFSNSTWPSVPDLRINVFGQQIGIGDASNGLCGGMVFAVRDYFEAASMVPPDTTNPSSGTLFDYIVKRLFDSFNLALPLPPPPPSFRTPTPPFGPGPVTYMHFMNPALPDHETDFSKIGLSYRGRAWVMINEEWPKFKADLDSGHLSPVALVEIKSADPTKLGDNHQVLAYGYELDGTDLTLYLYDPNAPGNDGVTMSLSLADPFHTTTVTNSVVSSVWCFFRPAYTFSAPPAFDVQWEPLGGVITSAPAVCSWASNRLDVFARGTDNALHHKWWDGARWSSWEQLGANAIASAPAAVSWGPNRIDVFVRGTDDALHHKWWDGTRWSGYESLGGTLTSAPAVCSWASGRLDVFVRGTNNALWHKWYDGGWSGWEALGSEAFVGDPAAVSWGPNRIDVFVRGVDSALHHKWWDGARWSNYEWLGGSLSSGPDACSWASGRLDVFARGAGNALCHKRFDGHWSKWEQLGANQIAEDPAAVSWGPNRIDVIVRGTDNAVYRKWWDGAWKP